MVMRLWVCRRWRYCGELGWECALALWLGLSFESEGDLSLNSRGGVSIYFSGHSTPIHEPLKYEGNSRSSKPPDLQEVSIRIMISGSLILDHRLWMSPSRWFLIIRLQREYHRIIWTMLLGQTLMLFDAIAEFSCVHQHIRKRRP